jgi:hypothetical protein
MRHCILQAGLGQGDEVVRMFRRFDLDVITVSDAGEALDKLWEHGEDIDLMVVETKSTKLCEEFHDAVEIWRDLLVLVVVDFIVAVEDYKKMLLIPKSSNGDFNIIGHIFDLCCRNAIL